MTTKSYPSPRTVLNEEEVTALNAVFEHWHKTKQYFECRETRHVSGRPWMVAEMMRPRLTGAGPTFLDAMVDAALQFSEMNNENHSSN
jgi:hypothetical protein